MKKIIILVVGVLIVIGVTVAITLGITKEQVEQITRAEIERVDGITDIPPRELQSIVDERFGEILNRVFRRAKARNVHQVTWVGHRFEVGELKDPNYDSSGTVELLADGFRGGSHSLPRTKLLDLNLNQPMTLKVTADISGELESPNPDCVTTLCRTGRRYRFAEVALYLIDREGARFGVALLGTRDHIRAGNGRSEFKFTEFTIENTGQAIIFTDSSGRRIVSDAISETEHRLSDLKTDGEWRLGINSHTNGEGYTEVRIKAIEIAT